MTDVCTHLDTIQVTALPENVPGCEDCLRIGGWWVHLRLCLTCGHVGCCDSSPNRNATAHARTSVTNARFVEATSGWPAIAARLIVAAVCADCLMKSRRSIIWIMVFNPH